MKKTFIVFMSVVFVAGSMLAAVKCTFCNGTGWQKNVQCPYCKGTGKVPGT